MMSLEKTYRAGDREKEIGERWASNGTFHFIGVDPMKTFSIDTPSPTVSGYLHLGHVYSYSQIDFIARFWRMNGRYVFFHMGVEDDSLPTGR
jgi:valyl-tRNA synthetase